MGSNGSERDGLKERGEPDHDEYDTNNEWHPVKSAAYDVNHLYEVVETDEAKEHIVDAVESLQDALDAERSADAETNRGRSE